MKSTLKLFKGLPVKSGATKIYKDLIKETIKKGFIFSDEVMGNYSEIELMKLVSYIEKELLISGEQMNSSFHKSWKKVQDADMLRLVIEQMLHYITTYGYQNINTYKDDTIFIPLEELEIPSIKGIDLLIIKGFTEHQLEEKIIKLASSGIALAGETLTSLLEITKELGIGEKVLKVVKNRELKVQLYQLLDILPSDPLEFLRYLVFRSTGNSLVIKNNYLIEQIKSSEEDIALEFKRYLTQNGSEGLASIFYRFKPIFLSLRKRYDLNKEINKIRRKAKTNHKPMKPNYLDNITATIKNEKGINIVELEKELDRVNIFRKIRLSNALSFRCSDPDSILYKIRNGSSFVKEFDFGEKNIGHAKRVNTVVIKSIVKDLSKQVSGKKIYLPEGIKYALPSTEKQFTGNFPTGTRIEVDENMIFGIHWTNLKNKVIDLDLSTIGIEGKIGWDSRFRSEDRNILFSGDITSAPKPKGASELFYIKKSNAGKHIVILNYYNFDEAKPVEFNILVAKEQPTRFGGNYTVNPNNLMANTRTKIERKQKIIGLLDSNKQTNRFYFTNVDMGFGISSGENENTMRAWSYLSSYYESMIDFKDILLLAGADVVNTKDKVDIDLSPGALEKDTIINLLLS